MHFTNLIIQTNTQPHGFTFPKILRHKSFGENIGSLACCNLAPGKTFWAWLPPSVEEIAPSLPDGLVTMAGDLHQNNSLQLLTLNASVLPACCSYTRTTQHARTPLRYCACTAAALVSRQDPRAFSSVPPPLMRARALYSILLLSAATIDCCIYSTIRTTTRRDTTNQMACDFYLAVLGCFKKR